MRQLGFMDPIYNSAFMVIVDSNHKRFMQFLKDHEYKEIDDVDLDTSRGYCIALDPHNSNHAGYCLLLWFHTRDLQVLVHEIAHATMHVFAWHGVPIREENSEAFAYYQEYLFKTIRKGW